MTRISTSLGYVLFLLAATPSFGQTSGATMTQPIVAVAKMDDQAGSGQSGTLTQMILTAIAGTQKFRVMERGQLDVLTQEQVRGRSGLVTSRNGGKVGGFQAADYQIYGTITSLSASKSSDFGSTLLLGALSGGSKGGQATNCYGGKVTLSVDIRITDGSSGQIRYVNRIDETQKVGTICGEGVPQANAAVLLRSAAEKIAYGLVTAVYPVKVANVSADGTVILNYGQGSVVVGNQLTVFAPGEKVIDPDTGREIGSSETAMGILQVTDVQNSFSKARPIAGFNAGPPQVRYIARPATAADIAQFKSSKRR
ncbi:CsgG/HfaB family protein [Novosphingobium sp.]|uniref:CsgG/HfaB family protein n=1 Tax=Novosphingobium sp. TaxID=1874826 RepID=UPI000BD0D7EB|nr:CsgG/HfaB family protein [Novosphingobium sp.]OYW16683.1 MAG: hypothetical protein B7Z39_00455 [Novosphingobium sp. 12-64-8]